MNPIELVESIRYLITYIVNVETNWNNVSMINPVGHLWKHPSMSV